MSDDEWALARKRSEKRAELILPLVRRLWVPPARDTWRRTAQHVAQHPGQRRVAVGHAPIFWSSYQPGVRGPSIKSIRAQGITQDEAEEQKAIANLRLMYKRGQRRVALLLFVEEGAGSAAESGMGSASDTGADSEGEEAAVHDDGHDGHEAEEDEAAEDEAQDDDEEDEAAVEDDDEEDEAAAAAQNEDEEEDEATAEDEDEGEGAAAEEDDEEDD